MSKNVLRYSPKPKIQYETDVLTFGQYRGKTVEFILNVNPGYIVWLEDDGIADVEQEIYSKAVQLEFEDALKNYDWGLPDPYDLYGDDD